MKVGKIDTVEAAQPYPVDAHLNKVGTVLNNAPQKIHN